MIDGYHRNGIVIKVEELEKKFNRGEDTQFGTILL
jgi:hypothetical protein